MRMEVDTVPPPLVPTEKTIGPKDYIDDATLPHIVALLEENTRRAAEKAEEWKREVRLQEEHLDTMDSDEEYNF
jgi:hypothetical protein